MPEVSRPGEFEELLELEAGGMIHRDIKPQNILRKPDGHVVVIDFNIAPRAGDPVSTLSGTPPYQAPDVDYTEWDVSADLFATGVTLYELACQHHPYGMRGRPSMASRATRARGTAWTSAGGRRRRPTAPRPCARDRRVRSA